MNLTFVDRAKLASILNHTVHAWLWTKLWWWWHRKLM